MINLLEAGNTVYSVDLDNVVIRHSGAAEFAHALEERLLYARRLSRVTPDTLLRVKRNVTSGADVLSLLTLLSELYTEVDPRVKERIAALYESGAPLYANSGRQSSKIAIASTKRTLERGGVLPLFTDFYFRPPRVLPAVGKADGIRRLIERYPERKMRHVENDWQSAELIAHLFPNVVVYLDPSDRSVRLNRNRPMRSRGNVYFVNPLRGPK